MEFIMDLFNQIGKMTSDLANGIVKETGKVLWAVYDAVFRICDLDLKMCLDLK